MKKSIGLCALLASLVIVSTANADTPKVGMDVDLGFPSGLGVGVAFQPGLHWLRLTANFQENYIAPGLKGSVTLSPIKFVVFPELQFDAGFFARENLPFSVEGYKFNAAYSYEDVMMNIGFGNRDKAFFFLSGGATHLDASIGGLPTNTIISNKFFSNPSFNGWLPAGKLGFVAFFN